MYKEKYIKYKTMYTILKNQLDGGGNSDSKFIWNNSEKKLLIHGINEFNKYMLEINYEEESIYIYLPFKRVLWGKKNQYKYNPILTVLYSERLISENTAKLFYNKASKIIFEDLEKAKIAGIDNDLIKKKEELLIIINNFIHGNTLRPLHIFQGIYTK
jgi:hypothetical protein